MTKIRKIVENSLYFLSSNLITFTLGFISAIILARTLKPTNLGIFHQVQWFTGLISTFLSLGFLTCLIKYTAMFRAKGEQRNIMSMIRFVVYTELFITGVSTIFLILFATPIADMFFSPQESRLFIIGFLAITPGMLTAIFSAVLEGSQLFKYQGLHALTITPAALLVKILLMLNGFGVESLLWSNLFFSLFNLLFYFFAAKREHLMDGWQGKTTMLTKVKKEILKYNRSVFSIAIVDQIVWSRSENFFLGRFCHASQVAYYNLSQNLILKLTGIIPNLMWKILLPVASEQEGDGQFENRKKTYYHSIRYSAFILFPLITICLICAYEIIFILYGQDYSQAEGCFQILCIGALITSLTQPGAAMIYACNKQQFIFYYGSCLAVLNILMDFILIPRYGALGASICFTTVTVLGAIGGFIFIYKNLKLKVPWVSLLKITFACNCMALVVFLLIRQDTSLFNIFSSFKQWVQHTLSFNPEFILGARTIRLLFSVTAGCIVYLLISLSLFSLSRDDIKIIRALEKYLPKSTVEFLLKWKQK
ncbi:MAG: oligosaccharide flippase family protein [Fibrobacteria bacterium]|nr:oligosaccharide flippase family protein [Fibrobacteria bacterium]